MVDIERVGADAIRIVRLLDAPVDTVWRYLTDPELRGQWFAAGPVEPHTGGSLDLCFDHDDLSEDDVPYPEQYAPYKGIVSHEKVVRFEPPHVFAFTFEGQGDSVVTFELFPEGEKTRLVLTHSGIKHAVNFVNFGGGWHAHLAVLQARLAGGGVRDFWKLHAESEAAVAKALG